MQEQADARPLLHVILSQVVGHHEPSGGDDGREAEHEAAEQPDPQAILTEKSGRVTFASNLTDGDRIYPGEERVKWLVEWLVIGSRLSHKHCFNVCDKQARLDCEQKNERAKRSVHEQGDGAENSADMQSEVEAIVGRYVDDQPPADEELWRRSLVRFKTNRVEN